jgi:hypothetical protein
MACGPSIRFDPPDPRRPPGRPDKMDRVLLWGGTTGGVRSCDSDDSTHPARYIFVAALVFASSFEFGASPRQIGPMMACISLGTSHSDGKSI